MLDLGSTLIDAQRKPFPHVREALTALGAFKTADGKPLRSCLVSDYTMLLVPPAPTPARVRPLFDEYVAVLAAAGLRAFFEPVDRRVTLSTHAGVNKPAAAVFEKALSRLHVKAGLDECLFITENGPHIAAAKALGMQALRFREKGSAAFDFDDWSQAPALIAQRVGAPGNLHAAVHAHLAAVHGVDVDELQAHDGAGPWGLTGRRWHAVALPGHGTVHVALPVKGHVSRDAVGKLKAELPAARADEAKEAETFARSLATHGQIADDKHAGAAKGARRVAATAKNPTHAIETDAQGRRRLVRRRFSAV